MKYLRGLRRILLVISLLFLPAAYAGQIEPEYHINIYYVETPQETFTVLEEHQALRTMYSGMAWWDRNTFDISSTQVLSVTYNVRTEWYRLQQDYPADIRTLNVFIVDDTENPDQFVLGNRTAVALGGWHTIWILQKFTVPHIFTHEMGHAIYDLPDIENGDMVDIMAWTAELAYSRHFIGCESLALLHEPCKRYYVPFAGDN